MKTVKNLVIGFGKAGKTIAGALAKANQSTILVEKDPNMFGGTCINIACIPSKTLENAARMHHNFPNGDDEAFYQQAIENKNAFISKLREKNRLKLVNSGVELIVGQASFVDSKTVEVTLEDGSKETIQAETIVINTGATPFIPPFEGIQDNPYIYTSTELLSKPTLPKHLVIVGAGFIGLEFASYYANFGSKVTILNNTEQFLPREDDDMATLIEDSFVKRGVTLLHGAKTTKFTKNESGTTVYYESNGQTYTLESDCVLIATGRTPNTKDLHLENAGVAVGKRGEVLVDEHLKTNVEGIYAAGDVHGDLQFTYFSYDDYRILSSELLKDTGRTASNRGLIPFSVFIDPAFSKVGYTEKQLQQENRPYRVFSLDTAAIPKANVLKQPVGKLKVLVDEEDHILGAMLFCPESYELIHLFQMAIKYQIPYTELRDNIYTHPTMSESFIDLFQ